MKKYKIKLSQSDGCYDCCFLKNGMPCSKPNDLPECCDNGTAYIYKRKGILSSKALQVILEIILVILMASACVFFSFKAGYNMALNDVIRILDTIQTTNTPDTLQIITPSDTARFEQL